MGTILIEQNLAAELAGFIDDEKIPICIVTAGSHSLTVCRTEKREQSTNQKLFSGGWITCETARQLADELELKHSELGKLLDYLEVKVRQCELGCF